MEIVGGAGESRPLLFRVVLLLNESQFYIPRNYYNGNFKIWVFWADFFSQVPRNSNEKQAACRVSCSYMLLWCDKILGHWDKIDILSRNSSNYHPVPICIRSPSAKVDNFLFWLVGEDQVSTFYWHTDTLLSWATNPLCYFHALPFVRSRNFYLSCSSL